MAIYTKTGDKGTTSLASGERVAKTDVRIEAYGTVDELNSWIGLLRAGLRNNGQWTMDNGQYAADDQLAWIQNKLFNLGAWLSAAPGEWITAEDVSQLERWIDEMQSVVPPLRAFVLPAGGEVVCRTHVCRTICRRAERRMIEAHADETALKWINRLSDYLFVFARWSGAQQGEIEAVWSK